MVSMLEWYLSTMCYLTLQEVVERRTELFKIINGDVFSPLKEWPLALRLLPDEDSFKMVPFLIGNGLAPRLAAEWVMLSQFWIRDHEKRKQRVIQAGFVLTNLEIKKKNTTGCVAYTKGKPRNAITEDIYSCICHGEQRGCHVV